MYEAMHSGVWLPASAWNDDDAWDRVVEKVQDRAGQSFDLRLIVTPQLDNHLSNPTGLQLLADGAERQNARGQGSRRWLPGDGPVIIVWPQLPTVSKWVHEVTRLNNDSMTLLEQPIDNSTSFLGWATAVGAYNAATNKEQPPIHGLHEQIDHILTCYENELAGPPRARTYGTTHDVLRDKLRALAADGYDNDFIVTYAIGIGYTGSLELLRRHYAAAQDA